MSDNQSENSVIAPQHCAHCGLSYLMCMCRPAYTGDPYVLPRKSDQPTAAKSNPPEVCYQAPAINEVYKPQEGGGFVRWRDGRFFPYLPGHKFLTDVLPTQPVSSIQRQHLEGLAATLGLTLLDPKELL